MKKHSAIAEIFSNNRDVRTIKRVFTAIIAAYDREEATRETVRRLQACKPAPAEILVHLDNGADFPLPEGVRVIFSDKNLGPGGGRNRLVREATHEWIASFDDDSYPMETDYFARLEKVVGRHLDAGVIACTVRHRDPAHDSLAPDADRPTATFVGCGCVYRRSAFLKTNGYVPLPVAYGMEEVDFALQLHDLGLSVIETPDLKVFHDTDLSHHERPAIAAGSIMNQALLAWARYPVASLPYGALQWINKIRDNLKRRRFRGTLQGILGTPAHLWKNRNLRQPVASTTLVRFRRLRQNS